MPWCRYCRGEYVDSVQRCSDCGAWLVDREPVSEKAEKKEKLALSGGEPYLDLVTVNAPDLAAQAEELLAAEGIPVWVVSLRNKWRDESVCAFAIRTPERWMHEAETALHDSRLELDLPEREDTEASAPHAESEPVLLAVVDGGMDAQAAEALLRGAGIRVYSRTAVSHTPTIITGITGALEFYVPKAQLDEARDVLGALPALRIYTGGEMQATPGDSAENELLDDAPAKRSRIRLIWILIFIFTLIALFGRRLLDGIIGI